MTVRYVWWMGPLGLVTALWVLVMLPPWLDAPWRQGIYAAFQGVCHQLPERSFHVHGVPLAVCQRCLGIYTGLVLGGLLRVLASRQGMRLGWLLLLPMGLDWGLDVLGLWTNTPATRYLTGLLAGLWGGYLLLQAFRQPAVMEGHHA